jgi:nitrilase
MGHNTRETWMPSMRHIAVEGRCFVPSANQYARRSHYPEVYGTVTGELDGVVSRGGSCIVDPFGNVLARPAYDREAVLVAEIDRNLISQGKFDLDVTGHYARPDVFRLFVNETDTPAVVFGAHQDPQGPVAPKDAE